MTLLLSGIMASVGLAINNPPPPPPPGDQGDYDIDIGSDDEMINVTTNAPQAGDDNLVWSHSGRYLAADRSDPNVPASDERSCKYIHVIDVSDLSNIGPGEARNSATNYGVLANITDWTVYQETSGYWYHILSSTHTLSYEKFGASGYTPASSLW